MSDPAKNITILSDGSVIVDGTEIPVAANTIPDVEIERERYGGLYTIDTVYVTVRIQLDSDGELSYRPAE